MRRNGNFKPILLHTGQHYDYEMSKVFFEDLRISEPDIHLGVGSGTHAEQTGRIMIEFEKVLFREKPDLVLLVGDINSTIACAISSSKLAIPIAHVEAGLRSFDRNMPEEINRIVTDSLSDYLFTPSKTATENLETEGISGKKIHFVGNVIIDTLLNSLQKANRSGIVEKLKLKKNNYAVLTLHRPENVDIKENLQKILLGIGKIQEKIKIIFPTHGRTRKKLMEFGFESQTAKMKNVKIIEPLGYLDIVKIMKESKFVLTDSGGIQEETTVLQIPCLTLRKTTERPETVSLETNKLVGIQPERVISESLSILNGGIKTGKIPELWDGKTAERIVKILAEATC